MFALSCRFVASRTHLSLPLFLPLEAFLPLSLLATDIARDGGNRSAHAISSAFSYIVASSVFVMASSLPLDRFAFLLLFALRSTASAFSCPLPQCVNRFPFLSLAFMCMLLCASCVFLSASLWHSLLSFPLPYSLTQYHSFTLLYPYVSAMSLSQSCSS